MAPEYFYSCGHRLRHCVTNERRKKERLNERDRKKKREGREKETNKKKQTNNCREGSAEGSALHRAPSTDFPISETIRGIGTSFRRNDA